MKSRIAGLSLSLTASIMPVFLLASLAPQLQRYFDIGATEFGVLNMVSFACWSISALFLGHHVDRTGGEVILAMAALVLAGALLGVSAARSWPELLLAIAVCGLASGVIPQAGYRVIWDRVPQRRKGLAFGVVQSGFPVATVITGVVAPVIARSGNWRLVFVLASVFVVVVCLLVSATRRGTPDTPASGEPVASRTNHPRTSTTVILLVGSVFANAATSALSSYFVLVVVDQGVSDLQAGGLFAVGGIVTVAARVLFGSLVDAGAADPLRLMSGLLIGGAGGVAMLFSDRLPLLLLATLLGFGLGWGWSGLLGYAIVHLYSGTPAASTGLVLTVAGGVGAACGPLLFGLAADHAGVLAAETGLIVIFCLAAVVIGTVSARTAWA
ncbi:hypothetical protein Aple_029310 [Acrocarpospora pleiomorpha]|uniref:Major facilitator superfamily (MFS) profile domain-containing protein n=1 Tax=Acrocarpospora pleiomorpha TaxID=90975 RepID=A0A5M3XEJ8_9ACTN|nr:MFS transporter [Acrocarpospora pleiomorpha]GES20035.1 hypothetical protein Aple_029310 [Acrocarpospora pleiomorpha]